MKYVLVLCFTDYKLKSYTGNEHLSPFCSSERERERDFTERMLLHDTYTLVFIKRLQIDCWMLLKVLSVPGFHNVTMCVLFWKHRTYDCYSKNVKRRGGVMWLLCKAYKINYVETWMRMNSMCRLYTMIFPF